MPSAPIERWTLSRAALERVFALLGDDLEAGAREYEVLLRKLGAFFERRGASFPEACADETLDRLARKVDAGLAIEHPRAYVFAVARRVLQESEKRRAREVRAQHDWTRLQGSNQGAPDVEARLKCLQSCLRALSPENRALIAAYYSGDGDSGSPERTVLARRLGLGYGALRIRAFRIRNQLVGCLRGCLTRRGAR